VKRVDPDPLQELAGVQQRMNRLFESAMARTNFESEGGLGSWAPVADVVESDDAVRVWLEVPGLGQEDVHLRVEGDDLVVSGEVRSDREGSGEQFHRIERSSGPFSRRFALPPDADPGSVEARCRDGVLVVTVARRGR
jgi:HSP20 family protein